MSGHEPGIARKIEPSLRFQYAHHGNRRRHERRLRVLGKRELLRGSLPDDLREILVERCVNFREHLARRDERIRQRLAHANGLTALTGKDESARHLPAWRIMSE